MDKVQKTFRSFQAANQAFSTAAANFRRSSRLLGGPMNSNQVRTFHKRHQNMLNAHNRRTLASSIFRNAVARAGVPYSHSNTMTPRQIMNIFNYAPPSTPGGFGGIKYEEAALRHRRKPSRVRRLSLSPKRSLKRRHSA